MSQENVELVRSLYALLDQEDDAVWDMVSSEFVVDFSRRHIDPLVVRGRDKARARYKHDLYETWERGSNRWQPQEMIDAGNKVVAFIRTGGKGKASGVEVEAHVWNVWTFRDGEPVGWIYFGEDRAAALEEAGLNRTDKGR